MANLNEILKTLKDYGKPVSPRDLFRMGLGLGDTAHAEKVLEQFRQHKLGKWEVFKPHVGRPKTAFVLDSESPDYVPEFEPPKEEQPKKKESVSALRKAGNRERRLREELNVERRKLRDAEREVESLRDRLSASNKAYADHKTIVLTPQTSGRGGSATAIICATDWHAEGNVDPDLVNGLNKFDLDIASKRIARLWEKSVYLSDFAQNLSNINHHVLWLGGDLINGAIHEELEESNFLGPADAVLFVQDHVAAGIDYLLKNLQGSLTVVTNFGNHGRTTKKMRFTTGYLHSWEYLAYCNLKRIYRNNPRVSFHVSKGYQNCCKVQGRNVRFHHGDAIKYNGGIGGITIPVLKKIAQWNKQGPADLDIFGHFHTFLDHWSFVSVGCLVGYNEYAMRIAADFQPPTQGFVVMDKTYGKVLAAPIYVEKAVEYQMSEA